MFRSTTLSSIYMQMPGRNILLQPATNDMGLMARKTIMKSRAKAGQQQDYRGLGVSDSKIRRFLSVDPFIKKNTLI